MSFSLSSSLWLIWCLVNLHRGLRQIWNHVKAVMPGAGEGLDRTQFACALRLVALAQSCHGVLPTAPSEWLEASGTPTPPPRLGPQPAGHTPRMCARSMPGVFEG